MSLMLHAGAQPVDFDALRLIETPKATSTHVPLPHHQLVDMVRYSLGYYEHEIVDETYGVTPDGSRFFGVMKLKSTYGDYTDVLGLRNSHDKSFPIALAHGSAVFVCDNLAFNGETVVKRRHTANMKRDLPGIVAGIIEPLRDQRLRQAAQFNQYHERPLELDEFDHLVMELYRRGTLNVTRIADVVDAYQNPPFDWGADPTAWRAFNAVTYALRGKVAEAPQLTQTLHEVLDGICTPVS